ncbi:MAG: TetR/AcrR family transcriptional regulator [Stackebrandtia sp.]
MSIHHNGPQSVYLELRQLLSSPPVERADAARNRAAILDAAARLFAEHGVDAVSMDAVAAAAGVGKGTLFRRFGDKSGLATALLNDRESELQQKILSGPPPLGPGAEPELRLTAFVESYTDYLLDCLDLVRMSETASPGARYRIGAYGFWRLHVSILLNESGVVADPDFTAHALLAVLAAEHVAALREEMDDQRIRQGLTALAAALLTPSPRG